MHGFSAAHKDRFHRVVRMAGAGTSAEREALWNATWTAYAEEHRAYHTAQHIIECLKLYDQHVDAFGLSPLAFPQYTAMELAIWWHDIVYHVGSTSVALSNEQLSASWAYTVLDQVGVGSTITNAVHELILATDYNKPHSTHSLAPWIVDIDMAILGMSGERRFVQYERQVAKEYTRLFSYHDYHKGRLHFLRTLLGKEHLYQTDVFRSKYEEHARNNIQQLIQLIKKLEAEGG